MKPYCYAKYESVVLESVEFLNSVKVFKKDINKTEREYLLNRFWDIFLYKEIVKGVFKKLNIKYYEGNGKIVFSVPYLLDESQYIKFILFYEGRDLSYFIMKKMKNRKKFSNNNYLSFILCTENCFTIK